MVHEPLPQARGIGRIDHGELLLQEPQVEQVVPIEQSADVSHAAATRGG
jgi:hypothetical protein